MKNNLIRKLLCITLISAMIVASSFSALASDMGSTSGNLAGDTDPSEMTGDPTVGSDVTDTPDITDVPDTPEPTVEPVVTPEPTIGPTDVPSVTPTPGETATPTQTPSATPTVKPTDIPGADDIDGIPVDGGEDEPGPGGGNEQVDDPGDPSITVDNVIAAINGIGEVTLEKEGLILSARSVYEALSADQKVKVGNYDILVAAENTLSQLKGAAGEQGQDPGAGTPADPGEGTQTEGPAEQVTVIEGPATMISSATHVVNLKAGRAFYLKQLRSNYALTFNEKFEDVMDEIEAEYIAANKLDKEDEYLVHNWQDILAVYVMEQKREGKSSFKLNRSSKEALAAIFAEMNAIERDKKNIALVDYKGMDVEDYIKLHKSDLTKEEVKTLRKYAGQDCALLCATITAAKGFIRQSAGEEVSEERVAVIQAGYSLVGKVAYFWGGKSSVLGWDDRWGSAAKVSSAGSSSTGRIRAYGLDCSGFVDWAFNNGYQDTEIEDQIGHGTSDQWNRAETIQAKEAQAGDLVFQRGPEAGSDNHVGILVGKSSNGDWIAVHCSGSQNGVTVGEAYSASFRYIRRPTVYPTVEELRAEKGKKKTELLEAAAKKNALRQAAENTNPNRTAQLD